MKNLLTKTPWPWVVAAFVILISAWTTLIFIAVKNAPQKTTADESAPLVITGGDTASTRP
ncbi:MAG: hypothetical protein AAGJ79_11410 [Verrucomicrobiota bacterium]